jgi:hypothetical protein
MSDWTLPLPCAYFQPCGLNNFALADELESLDPMSMQISSQIWIHSKNLLCVVVGLIIHSEYYAIVLRLKNLSALICQVSWILFGQWGGKKTVRLIQTRLSKCPLTEIIINRWIWLIHHPFICLWYLCPVYWQNHQNTANFNSPENQYKCSSTGLSTRHPTCLGWLLSQWVENTTKQHSLMSLPTSDR